MAKQFGKRSTAEQVSQGVDLSGKNVLVTGANTGLGKETTRVLALCGAHVTMACRDMVKAEQAREDILAAASGGIDESQLALLQLDLNSLDKTQQAAEEYCQRGEALDILINNAGIMIPMERRTADGFEAHLGINHLAHFLFTNLLLDSLTAANGARVIALSSLAMSFASMKHGLDDINWENRKFSGWPAYGNSKLMNYLFARELSKRYEGNGIIAHAVHPGVVSTELGRDQSGLFSIVGVLATPFMKNVEQGAATQVLAAISPEFGDRGGLYFKDCRVAKPQHKLANDAALAEELWQRSAELVGLEE
ncbi:MAG: SDR family oxidoreductase [Halioglobus sp.]